MNPLRSNTAEHGDCGGLFMTPQTVQSMIKRQIRPAVVLFLLITLVTGIMYPLLVTGIAQVIFPVQANGYLIEHDGSVAGSALIGQPFTSPDYFWGRPSATSPFPYNAGASSGSNLGPDNPALIDAVKARADALHAADPTNQQAIPVDLVTASGSGLDPDISIAAAQYQVSRVARERNLNTSDVQALVDQHIEPRQFGILGEPRVNVLSLNLALDSLSAHQISVPSTPATVPRFEPPSSTVFGMMIADWLQLIAFFVIIALLIVPVGGFMAQVYTGQPNFISSIFAPVERRLLALSGIPAEEEMDWKMFATAMMIFSLISIAVVFILMSVQNILPLNPAGLGPVPADLSLNTAISFVTNTNWQAYAGETTVSYLTQMAGLAVQNFASAAVGMSILVALIYAFSRRSMSTIGNFWVLLVRSVMILLPISLIIALVLVSQGVPQTFGGPVTVPLLDPVQRQHRGACNHPDHPAWSGGIPGRDQTCWHERRRLFQYQFRSPV